MRHTSLFTSFFVAWCIHGAVSSDSVDPCPVSLSLPTSSSDVHNLQAECNILAERANYVYLNDSLEAMRAFLCEGADESLHRISATITWVIAWGILHGWTLPVVCLQEA